jgi:ABC-type lipoprotein release transport system permease subunit
MLGIGNDISEISFNGAGTSPADAASRLQQAAPSLDIQPWTTLQPLAYTIETYSQSYIGIWLMIIFVLMAIGIVNTQLMAVFERKHEFGLLQALGMRPRLILWQVMVESGLLIGLGVFLGIALTALSLAPFRNGLDLGRLAAAMETYGFGDVIYPRFDAAQALRLSFIVWALGVIAALWPARSATRIAPAAALAEP